MQAIRRTKSKNGRHDHVIEPIYIFCSALVKFFYRGKIDAKTVQEYLSKEKSLQQQEVDPDVVYIGSSNADDATTSQEQQQPNSAADKLLSGLNQYTAHLPVDTANAYNAIFNRIAEIRVADSKGWHHRPIYRVCANKTIYDFTFTNHLLLL